MEIGKSLTKKNKKTKQSTSKIASPTTPKSTFLSTLMKCPMNSKTPKSTKAFLTLKIDKLILKKIKKIINLLNLLQIIFKLILTEKKRKKKSNFLQ
jgi:hypothetical protein